MVDGGSLGTLEWMAPSPDSPPNAPDQQGAFDDVYQELHRLADRLMGDERKNHTLQPTALVHEAFLRLTRSDDGQAVDRVTFLARCAVAMRRILIDHARGRQTAKRGGAWQRVTLQGIPGEAEEEVDLLALDTALEKLEELDPRQARIVELRFFSGMTGEEIATHMDVSRNTVVRELTLARAWLQRELQRGA